MIFSKKYSKLYKILILIFGFTSSFLFLNCSRKFENEQLQLKVKQNLALLQSNPQFVMYFNFQKMRETEFWKKLISDSLFASERNFGSFLNTLKTATGASISNGIDELYFSNSWLGDNAMVIKGTFDRNKIDDYLRSDSNNKKLSYPDNIVIYNISPFHFYFYFKDDFTICASNYLNQIESTLKTTDTTRAGLLTNDTAIRIIESIKYKDNLWMMSNQKTFIRGIFENFSESDKSHDKKIHGQQLDSLMNKRKDTASVSDTSGTNELDLSFLYNKVNSVSFSLKMSDEIDLVMQNNCDDFNSAKELKSRSEAVIALAKLSAQFSKKKTNTIIKLLDRIEINNYENILFIEVKIEQSQIAEIRKQKVF